MNRIELKRFFESKLVDFAQIETRIESLKAKRREAVSMEEDSLMQLNMGTCVFSVSQERAINILDEAIQIEQHYFHMMQERFHRAVGIMNGEGL
ncbi:hypothetical protein ACJ8S7_005100 [Klebsiella pneumoniae]|nr:hypothetical protein [Klebsiella pneumoniae]